MKHIITANRKIIKELAMTQNEWLEDAEKAGKYFVTEMRKFNPDAHLIGGRLVHSLGYYLSLDYAGDKFEVTHHNAKQGVFSMMHLDGSKYKEQDQNSFTIELNSWSYQWKAKGLKFRKITAKTPLEAVKKYVDWFKKNKEIILGE